MAFHVLEPTVDFEDNWHLEEICAHLEAVFRGEISQLGICVPPGCMKSLITSVLFPVWCWIRNPGLRFSVVGYDDQLTGTRDGGKVAQLVQSKWFQERWGDRVKVPTDPATSNVTTQAGGFRFATSIKGKYTGRHVHVEIVDDPIKPQDLSKAALAAVQNWRQAVAPTRLLPTKPGETGGRIYIMQRLHEDDAIGHAEREEQANQGSWVFLRLPMRFETRQEEGKPFTGPCRTKWGGDRRTEEGELLWKERFTPEVVALREGIMGSAVVAAQHQQRPSPAGGLIFNAGTFKFYTVAPARFDRLVISVDAAFKDLVSSDFVSMQVWGAKGGEFWLLDMVHGRLAFTATLVALKALCRKWPRATAKLIEDKANGTAIIDTLTKEISGLIAVNPKGGKVVRAQAVEPYFEAGNVYLPEPKGAITNPAKQSEPEPCPWVDVLTLELIGFPTAANDDAVDACTQFLVYIRKKPSRYQEAMDKLKEKAKRRAS